VRRIYYNITVTTLSVAVALLIGTVELLQVFAQRLAWGGGFFSFLANLDFGAIGYAVVGLFVLTWVTSAVVWKAGRIEQRWSALVRSD
jgi:high-affinity nickel-transport protein